MNVVPSSLRVVRAANNLLHPAEIGELAGVDCILTSLKKPKTQSFF